MKMKLVIQPPRSRVCGQACVAMIAELPLVSVCGVFGHAHATTTKHVTDALARLGVEAKPLVKATRGFISPEVKRAIIRLHWGSKKAGTHWIVFYDGDFYCPVYGKNPDWNLFPLMRYTSYIEVEK